MSQRYLGGIITANPTTPTMTSESGVWTLEQQFQYNTTWSPKIVGNSLRIRNSASAYLSRTFGTPTSSKTWTYSGWVKRGSLSTYGVLLSGGTNASNYGEIYFDQSSYSLIYFDYVGAATNISLTTNAVFRDPSAWYHVVVAVDTTQATNTNRVKIYVNGVQQTFSSATYPAQNANTALNTSGYSGGIGALYTGSWGLYSDQYIAENYFVDGQALTPSSFGAYDTTGTWQPLPYTGTYGNNGFYLTFADNSAATAAALGKDYSGNGNNWTPNNISLTAGTTYDWMLDSPTNWTSGTGNGVSNYCVLNPLDKDTTNGSLSQGNLYWLFPAYSTYNAAGVRGTLGVNTGKWYWEFQNVTYAGSGNASSCGMTPYTGPLYGYTAFAGTIPTYIGANATVFSNSVSFVSYGMSASLATGTTLFASYASGDVINIAVDFDAGKIWIGKNGTWYNSGSPSDGTNATSTFTTPSTSCFPEVESVANLGGTNVSSSYPNFGQRPFSYTVPTGFKALNTLNLPDPNITNGAQYMNILLYTGDGTTSKSVTGLNFQPDMVYVKNRSAASDPTFSDAVRGITKVLYTDATAGESTAPVFGYINSVSSTGINVNSGGSTEANFNKNGQNYVAWNWLAGNATSSNTSGSITSTVSVNTKAGFSVVTFATTGSAGTVGHGLGVAPSLIIAKNRGTSTAWPVYHSSIGATYRLVLNTTDAAALDTSWNNTAPTSSVFSENLSGSVYNFVAYCWAAVAGYSAFGSYTGNGSADGPFVYCGFRPRFVMAKNITNASDWFMTDTSRDPYNVTVNKLTANTSTGESSNAGLGQFDILSNGFKQRQGAGTGLNNSGDTYIYAAFAENPFKIARAR